MVNKRNMRKCDAHLGHEARINKLLLKKPPGIMSASSTSSVCEQCTDQPSKAFTKKGGRRRGTKDSENIKGGRRKETNSESGARHRIFGDGLRSMGLARVNYPMHPADGTLHRSELGQ